MKPHIRLHYSPPGWVEHWQAEVYNLGWTPHYITRLQSRVVDVLADIRKVPVFKQGKWIAQ